ncbi:MAG TPA: hypothetical protein DD990_27140, partial [Cyanobacteria bacterium UBA11368]|nr:hypothetical protein [Cyanobacteria bacterium UBA11368]
LSYLQETRFLAKVQDVSMPTVYLKGGKTVRVRLEDLEDFLYENRDRIETRRKKLRRPPVDITTASTSSK